MRLSPGPRSTSFLLGSGLLALLLGGGCASTTDEKPTPAPALDPTAGPLKERALAARAREARRASVEGERPGEAERGAFDFGLGPVRPRRPAVEEDDPGAPEAAAEGRPEGPAPRERARPADPLPERGVRITWEALAVEREQVENPRFGRRPLRSAPPDLKLVLVSPDHPTAVAREQGKASTRDADGAQVAVLKAEEIRALVQGLRQIGFYEVALPTGSAATRFSDRDARGRVTVEVDGESRTVLSMRGQGASAATRSVPRVYSEAKQAIAALRNRSPTLNVLTAGGQTAVPKGMPRRRGESRVLTEEEAAEILGPEPQPRPAGDDWGLGR